MFNFSTTPELESATTIVTDNQQRILDNQRVLGDQIRNLHHDVAALTHAVQEIRELLKASRDST